MSFKGGVREGDGSFKGGVREREGSFKAAVIEARDQRNLECKLEIGNLR